MPSLAAISALRPLLAAAMTTRGPDDLPEALAAIAAGCSHATGHRSVVIHVYRPAWDDYEVLAVHGDPRGAQLGDRSRPEDWPAAPEAVLASSEVVVPLRAPSGEPVGLLCVADLAPGRIPDEAHLALLLAVAEHASLAVHQVQDAAEASRERSALTHLLAASAQVTASEDAEPALEAVTRGVSEALGFERVVVQLVEDGVFRAHAAVGWPAGDTSVDVSAIAPARFARLFSPESEVEGCHLLTSETAHALLDIEQSPYTSRRNGNGPRAWRRHWLTVPLRDRDGLSMGFIWVDEPADLLLPTRSTLAMLRLFANQAATALEAVGTARRLRRLADHDSLTGLGNRRAFTARLETEVARAQRSGEPLAVVLADLDGLKQLNDRHGHEVGDRVLRDVARVLGRTSRSVDLAYRLGGDEFALLFPDTTAAGAEEAMARVLHVFASGVSHGAAELGAECPDGEALLQAADRALYACKAGR